MQIQNDSCSKIINTKFTISAANLSKPLVLRGAPATNRVFFAVTLQSRSTAKLAPAPRRQGFYVCLIVYITHTVSLNSRFRCEIAFLSHVASFVIISPWIFWIFSFVTDRNKGGKSRTNTKQTLFSLLFGIRVEFNSTCNRISRYSDPRRSGFPKRGKKYNWIHSVKERERKKERKREREKGWMDGDACSTRSSCFTTYCLPASSAL